MNKNRFFTGITLVLCLYYTNTVAKSLTFSNAVMKSCIFDNNTMSFTECLIKRGKIKEDPTPPKVPKDNIGPVANTLIADDDREPIVSDNPTPPDTPPVVPPTPSIPNASTSGTASANSGPAAGNEDPEKEACIAAGSNWDNNSNTCADQSGGGNRWGAIWNHQTMKYECMNAKEWADYEFAHGIITEQEKQWRYDWFKDFLYDENGDITPMNKDLQWYIKTSNNAFPKYSKCASANERQCYQSGGGFDWSDYINGKCYKHNNDKTKCEAIGAKFKKENGISYCDCKISDTNKEIHWNSRDGVCQYKIGNETHEGWSSFSYFFEVCLLKYLNEPFFNGMIKPTGISAFRPLKCQ